MYGSLTERITRSLAYMLRHQPEEFDLELDGEGYGDLEEVVCALNERLGEPIEAEDVVEAIESGDRQRYEIVDDRIRALYGHSFPVEPGESVEPPEELYVGLGSRDADRAHRHGLDSGRRAFLHLARTWDEAREMGRRAAPEYAVITVQALDAWEDGIDFYDRISLFLSESIPTEFLEISEVFTDGIRREGRSGGRRGGPREARGRGRRGGRRGGDGRRDSARFEDRGRDDERPARAFNERDREPRSQERDVPPARRAPERSEPEREERRPVEREERRPEREERRPVEREERRPEREERRPEREPRKSAPAPQPARRERPVAEDGAGVGGFGAGLTARESARESAREEPRSRPARTPRPAVEDVIEPAPKPRSERPVAPSPVEEPAQDSDSGGFGAGIL